MQKTFFRVSIKALVIKNDKILLIQEPDSRWELPGGGLEHNETIERAIKRELKEEIGVGVAEIANRPLYV